MPQAHNQSHYTNSELMAMQQDAIRRVQEMHKRSQQRVQGNSQHSSSQPSHTNEKTKKQQPAKKSEHDHGREHKQEHEHEHTLEPVKQASPIEKIFKDLNLDSDRIILLALVVLLLNEGADKTLVLALVYMLI